jgi:carboxymethylenebutenolidase
VILAALISLAGCDSGTRQTGAVENGDGTASVATSGQPEDAAIGESAEPPVTATGNDVEAQVVAETLAYAEVDNQLVHGHFVFPIDMVDPLPGLIVIHEWWGLNDDVRAMADRIAAQGYIVLAIDLFGGRIAESPADARPMMIEVVENPELANDNIRQAYEFLVQSGQSPRIGVLGWDFGGGWSLNAAIMLSDDLDAAVVYYGQVTDDEARLAPLDAPLLGLFAGNDRGIPAGTVRAFEQALENLGKTYEIEIYPGTEHSFANPSATQYNAETAEQAWSRTIEFLDRYLAGNDE